MFLPQTPQPATPDMHLRHIGQDGVVSSYPLLLSTARCLELLCHTSCTSSLACSPESLLDLDCPAAQEPVPEWYETTPSDDDSGYSYKAEDPDVGYGQNASQVRPR